MRLCAYASVDVWMCGCVGVWVCWCVLVRMETAVGDSPSPGVCGVCVGAWACGCVGA